MDTKINPVIYWAPRVLGIIMVLFLAVFSLDVFSMATNLTELVVGLLMHNIPSFLLILVLVFCWRLEWLGAILFPLLGLAYSLSNLTAHWSVHLTITGPLIVIGLLFLLNWTMKRRQLLVN